MLFSLRVEYDIRGYLLDVGWALNCRMVEESEREKKGKQHRRKTWILVIRPLTENFIACAPCSGMIINFVMAYLFTNYLQ